MKQAEVEKNTNEVVSTIIDGYKLILINEVTIGIDGLCLCQNQKQKRRIIAIRIKIRAGNTE